MKLLALTLAALIVGCGPSREVVELQVRVDRLEKDLAAIQESAKTAEVAKSACPAAKVKAHDAWEAASRITATKKKEKERTSGALNRLRNEHWSEEADDRFGAALDRSIAARNANDAISSAVTASSSGAIAFRDKAERAAAYHSPPELDLTAAIEASKAAFEACKDVDP